MAVKDSARAQEIRADVRRWDDANKRNNAHYHEMMNFILGQQWEDQEAKLFEDYKKMPLTANKLAPMMNHMIGDQRRNTPNLQVEPDDGVEEQVAEVREALVKDISLSSDATVVYQTAFEQAVIGGFGAYAILPKYQSNRNFDQIPEFIEFKDPTKCFWDLGATHYCKVDGMFSGFRDTVSRKKFRSIYGDDVEKDIGNSSTDVTESDNITTTFSDENSIILINHFGRESSQSLLYQLSNGDSVTQSELKKLKKMTIGKSKFYLVDDQPVTVVKERDITIDKIMWSIWGGDYKLEETVFPTSTLLPVLFVDQKSFWDKNGKQIVRSFFKDAKDTQRFINYLRTQIAYLIKVSRYDQFMVSRQNVRGADTQAMWRDPSTQQGGLWYDESPTGAKPERLEPPELSQSLMLQYESATQDLQATTGIYQTMMGDQGNEISGDAIDSRIRTGSYNTYIPRSSLDRAITTGGAVIDEMIPNLYDSERVVRLNLKSTGTTKVTLNKQKDEYGTDIENDMTKGSFKIRLVAGQSLEGQKADDLESMDTVLAKNPALFALIADLYAEALPMANSIEIRNRLRTQVPQEIIQAGKTGQPIPPKPPQPDPMVQLKMAELQMRQSEAQMKMQAEIKKLELQEQQMVTNAHIAGADFGKEIQKIQMERESIQAHAAEQQQRFQAEMAKIMHDSHVQHAQNVVKILTHSPNFNTSVNDNNGDTLNDSNNTQQ